MNLWIFLKFDSQASNVHRFCIVCFMLSIAALQQSPLEVVYYHLLLRPETRKETIISSIIILFTSKQNPYALRDWQGNCL